MVTFDLNSQPCSSQQNILNKCKAWIGSMMAMLSKNKKQQISKRTLVWVFVVVDVCTTSNVETTLVSSLFVVVFKIKINWVGDFT